MIELLVVLGISVVLLAFAIGSLAGSSQARKLSTSGNLLVELANQARQNSISQNVLTALVLVEKSGNSNWDGRLVILAKMGANDTQWAPVTKWQQLPLGIVVDPQQSQTFLTSPTLPVPITGLQYLGAPLSSSALAYQVFMPDGRLLTNSSTSSSSPLLYLVPGLMQGTSVVYLGKSGTTSNYYEITINPYTGTSIVDRP